MSLFLVELHQPAFLTTSRRKGIAAADVGREWVETERTEAEAVPTGPLEVP